MAVDWLAERFEDHRPHLRAVAYRMLGSQTEADDAVQEAWLRLSRSHETEIENLGGWLTTAIARICLDMLRARAAGREQPLDGELVAHAVSGDARAEPESEALLADAVGPALMVVLEMLAPAERVAFVLHDVFAVSFDEIANVVGRSPEAARQLASRARRRVQGAARSDESEVDAQHTMLPGAFSTAYDATGAAGQRKADADRQRRVVDAFLAAAHEGNFAALMAVLDPDVVVRPDATSVSFGTRPDMRGAEDVSRQFAAGRARGAVVALIDGVLGLAWSPAGQLRGFMTFSLQGERITEVRMIADPERVRQATVVPLPAS
ncbi:MAG TPA: sigma-70 family RNA polymerase sigma factor [Chloroflexota bacterium]|nr:sigma-70 family RNA polymerase sigma factor [Chloroflexota bacterium]